MADARIKAILDTSIYIPFINDGVVHVEDEEECKYYECDLIKKQAHTCITGDLHPLLINAFATIFSPFLLGQVYSAQSTCKILSEKGQGSNLHYSIDIYKKSKLTKDYYFN